MILRVESGAIVTTNGNGIHKIHLSNDIPQEKVQNWHEVMKEFDKVQKEMLEVYNKVMGGR